MKPNTWLITGGAGFIGRHTAAELIKQGQKVIIFDNFSTSSRHDLKNIKDKAKIIKGDITKPADLAKAFKNVDYVIHLAALVSVPESVEKPAETQKINTEGSLNVLQAALDAKVKRVVLASSAAVYGNLKTMPYREASPTDCRSPYAATKLAAEELFKMFYKTYGLETVCLRYFNVFGPGQNLKSQYAAVVAKFIDFAKKGDTFYIDSNGRQTRDFIYIADIVKANIFAVLKAKAGEVYNIAGGKTSSLLQMAKIIESLSGKKMKRAFRPKRAGDVRKSSADISKAKKAGFKPVVSLRLGLKETWESR